MTRKEVETYVVKKYSMLHRWAFSFAGNRFDADDLAQEAALKAIEHCDYFESITDTEKCDRYIYTIIKNSFYDKVRHDSFVCEEESCSEDEEGYSNEDILDSIADVRAAISHIRTEYRKALEMFMDGFKYKEIADEMGLSIGSVCTLVNRGRQAVIEYMR